MNILITGGAGFIGSHLAEFHLHRGDGVLALDDLSSGSEENLSGLEGAGCKFVNSDILTWDELEQEVERADRIYHMAAVVGTFRVLKQPIEVTRVNVLGTERLLDCVAKAQNLPEVVIASSSSVYGHSHSNELHEGRELVFPPGNTGHTGYALSKLTIEIQARAYRQMYGIPVSIPRLFNAVGPGPGIDIFFHGCVRDRLCVPHPGPLLTEAHGGVRAPRRSLQRNDLQQRDHFHKDVDERMKDLQQHVVGFFSRQADRAATAAAAASAAAAAGPSSSADSDTTEVMESISTARQRALDDLPTDFRRAIEEGNLAMVNGYLGISPLEQVRASPGPRKRKKRAALHGPVRPPRPPILPRFPHNATHPTMPSCHTRH